MARSARKVVHWILGSILLLVIVGAVALWALVDTGAYKQQLETLVKEKTGRELVIAGPLRLTLFPALGVKTEKVALGNAPGFGDAPMLEVGEMAIHVEVMPLLKGRVQVDTVILDGLRLRLSRNRQGVTNWDDLLPPSTGQASPELPLSRKPAGGESGPLPLLAVAGIRIRDARIDWQDDMNGQTYHLGPLDLSVGRVTPGRPFPITARIGIESHAPDLRGTVSLSSKVAYEPVGPQIRLADLEIKPELNGKALPGERLAGRLVSPKLGIDLQADRLDSPRLQWRQTDFALALLDISVKNLRSAPDYRARLEVPAFDPRKLLNRLAVSLPPMADRAALASLTLTGDIRGNTRRAALQQIRLILDDSTLTGEITLASFTPLALRYTLALDGIDADRYLPPPATNPASKAPAPPAGTATAAAGEGLPLDFLRRLDAKGLLTIGRLKAMNLHSERIRIPLEARNGRIRLAPLAARLYQGVYAGDIRLDVTGPEPRIRLDERLQDVQIGPLLADLIGDDKIRGTATLSAKLAADGLDPLAFRRTLNGTARFDFRDGAVKGFDLVRIEQELRARLKGQPVPQKAGDERTAFSRITGSARITNGLARNDDLRAALPHARAIGAGVADLVSEKVDYTLKVKFTSEVAGQSGTPYEKIDKPPLPIHFRGTFGKLDIRPDFETVLKELARRELKKKEAEVKGRARKELEKKAGELLKGLKLP